MKFELHDNKIGSLFAFTEAIKKNEKGFSINAGNITILWNRNETPTEIEVDGLCIQLRPNQLMTTTYLQHISYDSLILPLRALFIQQGILLYLRP